MQAGRLRAATSAGPGSLQTSGDRIDREVLPGKLIVPIIQLPAVMKTGVIGGTSERRLRGGRKAEMRQLVELFDQDLIDIFPH